VSKVQRDMFMLYVYVQPIYPIKTYGIFKDFYHPPYLS